jgi:hypothetical protein
VGGGVDPQRVDGLQATGLGSEGLELVHDLVEPRGVRTGGAAPVTFAERVQALLIAVPVSSPYPDGTALCLVRPPSAPPGVEAARPGYSATKSEGERRDL